MTFAQWRLDGFDEDFVASELAKGINPLPGGGLIYSGTSFFGEPLTLLETGVDFLVPITDVDRSHIISKALEAALHSSDYGAKALISEINKATRDFSRLPEKKYVIATGLSFEHFEDITRVEQSGYRLYVRRKLPQHLAQAHREAKHQTRSAIPRSYSEDLYAEQHVAIWVHVFGRSLPEAMQRGVETLDLRRGIWNFAINRGYGGTYPPPSRGPLNKVLAGPMFSLHHPDGTLAEEAAWVDPQYEEPQPPSKLQGNWDEIRKDEEGIRYTLKRSPYRTILEDALRRYSRALDMADLSNAFLNLWSLLETLTGVTPKDEHYKVVKRASFIYSPRERKTQEQILNHLRRYRNSYVHAGEDSPRVGAYLDQLRGQIERLLLFHLRHSSHFSSLQETARFLDLPPDAKDIRHLIDTEKRKAEEAKRTVCLAEKGLQLSEDV